MEAESGSPSSLFVRSGRRRYMPATAEQILGAARGVVDQRMQRGMPFAEPTVSCRFFLDRLSGYDREVFAAAFLDGRHRLIDYGELFFGTVDGAEVHPREVVKRALLHNASAVIVAHNHPSGTVEPSAADRAVTARLKQALSLVDVRLLDHIIVGGHETLTMAAKGWV